MHQHMITDGRHVHGRTKSYQHHEFVHQSNLIHPLYSAVYSRLLALVSAPYSGLCPIQRSLPHTAMNGEETRGTTEGQEA